MNSIYQADEYFFVVESSIIVHRMR